ncbi:MAG: phosphate acyltransferase PlsX [Chloroflexi bacterium]|nr:phosphate acyltransferase PlsX [Chloroflexota bacterium]
MGLPREKRRGFTVALDAMGGDHAPAEVVVGAVQAARQPGVEVLLVGDQPALEAELARHSIKGLPITLVPSEGVIQETDHPLQAMRKRPRASVLEAVRLVKAGRAQAMVTMGSTGAAMVSATLVLGLLEGLERPALGGPLLGQLSPVVLVDLGSNVDCRPSQLLGFAAIGVAFARSIQGVASPRVALLTVGAEEGKGNRQVREAYTLFKGSGLNFVGNVEGLDLFLNKADVVVCDGFVGNVLMKFTEGLGMALAGRLSELIGKHLPPSALKDLAGKLAALTNAAEIEGGGPLLGVEGIAVVGHGRARAASVAAAIRMARRAVETRLVETMRKELAALRLPVKG